MSNIFDDNEVWVDIDGFDGYYQVSNLGRIRSYLSRGCAKHREEPVILSGSLVGGYIQIALRREGRTVQPMVHRLVAEAFVPNPDKKPEVNHINGDKADNRAGNLEWTTRSENMKHAFYTLHRHLGSEGKKVRCIETGVVYPSIHAAARDVGTSAPQISAVVRGTIRAKRAGGFHWEFAV